MRKQHYRHTQRIRFRGPAGAIGCLYNLIHNKLITVTLFLVEAAVSVSNYVFVLRLGSKTSVALITVAWSSVRLSD